MIKAPILLIIGFGPIVGATATVSMGLLTIAVGTFAFAGGHVGFRVYCTPIGICFDPVPLNS